jgi:hypothetical protein
MASMNAMEIAGSGADSGIGCLRKSRTNQTITWIPCWRKPMTIREVAARLGDVHAEQISTILEGLTANGALAGFRLCLSNYYATSMEALAGRGSSSGTIITNSLKNMLLGCRYRMARH